MRHVLSAAVALVAGVVLGGLSPRAEVRRLQQQAAELGERACPPLLGSELVRALQPAPEPPPARPPNDPPDEEAPADEPDADDDVVDLAEGRTILAARRAQARAALIEEADPTPEQLEAVDAAVADLNGDLHALGEDLLARVRELGGTPPRSELYRFAADGLDVVLEADQRLHDALGERAGEVDEEALDPMSHLDPDLVDVVLELHRAGFGE